MRVFSAKVIKELPPGPRASAEVVEARFSGLGASPAARPDPVYVGGHWRRAPRRRLLARLGRAARAALLAAALVGAGYAVGYAQGASTHAARGRR